MRSSDKGFIAIISAYGVALIVNLGMFAGFIWLVVHFARKYW